LNYANKRMLACWYM